MVKNIILLIQGTVLVSCIALRVHSLPALAEETAQPGATSLLDQSAFDTSFSKLPTNISADTLTLNAKSRVFTYKGNVTVTQGDLTLVAKVLEGNYTDKNQIQKLVARGDVAITKQDIQATSQQAFYDARDATITLTDNPQLQQGESMLTADRIKVFLNENRSQAEGSVRVTMVQNQGNAGLPLGQLAGADSSKKAATPAPSSARDPRARREEGKQR
jgi:lipopolysaccharide export system protein LptA